MNMAQRKHQAETMNTIEPQASKGGPTLALTHENLDGVEARDQHGPGWNSSFDCLEKLLG